ncbi:FlxA-like family protein [Enterobacter sp.]|uniref:FlxA-like family protein n=1 Tax=Enterobacter sp. TaxID=42895 RepID=UPI00296F7F6D|nr:FlxA-like family protein [Enterobacter sp.]
MTTISTTTPSVQTGGSTGSSSAGNDTAAQISRLTQKINKLTAQLKEVANGSGTVEEKQKQQEQIRAQIQMLQAQLAQLQNEQAKEAEKKQEQKQLTQAEGINNPSDDHKIDIYI